MCITGNGGKLMENGKVKYLDGTVFYPCFNCDSKITKEVEFEGNKPWQGNFDNGVVDLISPGYGSIHDADMYVIAICDNCIEKKRKEKKLLYVGNYFGNGPHNDEEV